MPNKPFCGVCQWLFIVILAAGLAVGGCVTTRGTGDDGPISLAVWDPEALGPVTAAQDALKAVMASRILDRFGNSEDYTVVERERLLKLLEEQHIGSSALADEQTRLRLGRMIGCRQMVFGVFQVIGEVMRLDIRAVDVSSGRVLKTAAATAPADDVAGWLDAADRTAAELMAR